MYRRRKVEQDAIQRIVNNDYTRLKRRRIEDLYQVPKSIKINGFTQTDKPVSQADANEVTFSLSCDFLSINEGQTFKISLQTQNVLMNTQLGYTISGIDGTDINESTTGVFTVDGNGNAEATFTVLQDAVTENNELFTLSLDNGKASKSVLINSSDSSADIPLHIVEITPGFGPSLDPLHFNNTHFGASIRLIDTIEQHHPYNQNEIQTKLDEDFYDVVLIDTGSSTPKDPLLQPIESTMEKLSGWVARGGVLIIASEHPNGSTPPFTPAENTGTENIGHFNQLIYDLGGIKDANSGWIARGDATEITPTDAALNLDIINPGVHFADSLSQTIINSRSNGIPIYNSLEPDESVVHLWDSTIAGHLNDDIYGKIIVLGDGGFLTANTRPDGTFTNPGIPAGTPGRADFFNNNFLHPLFDYLARTKTTAPVPTIPESYLLESNLGLVSEGGNFIITLTTTGIDDNTTVPYTISGIDDTDIVQSTSGNFTVIGGTATLLINVVEDFKTDNNSGVETFRLELTGKTTSIAVTISDTSTESFTLSSDKTSVNEGGTFDIALITQGVANGTSVPYTVNGIDINDLTDGDLTGNFIVNNDLAIATFNIIEDFVSENTETFELSLTNKPNVTKSVIINNTSNETFTLASDKASVNEGEFFTITLTTRGITDTVTIPYTISGIDDTDITQSTSGNWVIPALTSPASERDGPRITHSSLIFNTVIDSTIETSETFTMTLGVASMGSTALLQSNGVSTSVTINNTINPGGSDNDTTSSFQYVNSSFENMFN